VAERTYSELSRELQLQAFSVVGVAQVCIAYLNLEEPEKALKLLQGAIADFRAAERAVTEYHRNSSNKSTQGESNHGNRTAA
jgi:hypothetical protein